VSAPAATSPSSATVSTPLAELAAPAATSTSSATVSAPAAEPLQPTRRSAHQRHSATKAAADAAPIATVNPSSDTVSPAVASPSSESDGTPAATAATPPVTHKGLSLSLLISFVVLVIVLGTLYPALSRWRKRKLLEQTGTPNLSFSNQTELAPDEPELRKVA
jgi:cobalamin biosynthesis Mg chelatase CobN